jgi:hypothetical protein
MFSPTFIFKAMDIINHHAYQFTNSQMTQTIYLVWGRYFVSGINHVSNQVYAYMPTKSYFFKNPNAPPT